jgi:IMP dehydrogenase
LEKTADKEAIFSFNDIEIIDDAQHPLIAITGSLRKEQSKEPKK